MSQLDQYYNEAIGGLDPIRQGQEAKAQTSFEQANAGLDAERLNNQATLDTQGRKIGEGQTTALTSLADNLRNQYMAGNVYLGARGAGDSSAAGMYSYALGRAGTKTRGDVLGQTRQLQSDLADRQASLDRLVTSEKGRIQSEHTGILQDIGNWFAQAKQQIQMAKAGDKIAMSKDVLDRALGAIDQAKSSFQAKQDALSQWAMNNSTSLNQLKTNLAGTMNVQIPGQSYALNAGISQPGSGVATNFTGGGSSSLYDRTKNPFALG
jgi:aminopeptidase N